MAMSRAQFSRDLEEGINAHFGMSYDTHETEYTKVFTTKRSKKAYEEQVLRVGLGEAVYKPEGGMISFDQGSEGWVSRVSFHTYALAFEITEEAIDDNLYADIGELYSKEIGKSMQEIVEVKCADVLNNAFNPAKIGGDQVPLCSKDHPLKAGGAFSNMLATSAEVSEEALEDMIIQLSGFVNDRHRPIALRAKKLIVPRQLVFKVDRILKSQRRVGTANNDINALKDGDYLPDGYTVLHRLIDPDAFWLQTNAELGLQFWERKGVKRGKEGDFSTGNMRWKAQRRFGVSFTDPRCVLGSAGSPI